MPPVILFLPLNTEPERCPHCKEIESVQRVCTHCQYVYSEYGSSFVSVLFGWIVLIGAIVGSYLSGHYWDDGLLWYFVGAIMGALVAIIGFLLLTGLLWLGGETMKLIYKPEDGAP